MTTSHVKGDETRELVYIAGYEFKKLLAYVSYTVAQALVIFAVTGMIVYVMTYVKVTSFLEVIYIITGVLLVWLTFFWRGKVLIYLDS